MIKYIKLTTIKVPCSSCQGKGHKWETVYHNQTKKCKCYLCDEGLIEIESKQDVTDLIKELLNKDKP